MEVMICLKNPFPIVIHIQEKINIWGKCLEYQTHIEENVDGIKCTFFKFNESMVYQEDGKLSKDEFGRHINVKVLSYLISKSEKTEEFDTSEFVYKSNIQLQLT